MKRIPMQPKEYDVLTEWRHVYCYTKHAGVCAGVKRRYRRRERRSAKICIRRTPDLA